MDANDELTGTLKLSSDYNYVTILVELRRVQACRAA